MTARIQKTGSAGPLIETEFQMISVPNSIAGQILARHPGADIHQTLLAWLENGQAQIFDVAKVVAPSGRASLSTSLSHLEIEPALSADLQSVDMVMTLTSKTSKLVLTASLPAGKITWLGSFDDPFRVTDATVFIFAQWKITAL